jgi:LysM repeat protein
MRHLITFFVVLSASLFQAGHGGAQSLSGSRASMSRQTSQARTHDFTYMETGARVAWFVDAGLLVPLSGNRDYTLYDVSYPYARPAVRVFVERLSSQYRATCGETLTVTSLTRPIREQPSNSSEDSVHPTGMAVDLRVPSTRACRDWLNGVLLSLEGSGVVEATRETSPPHYHVAVFPSPYETYVANLGLTPHEYIVQRGDSLTAIAERTGSSVATLRAANGIRGDLIRIGQALQVPDSGERPAPEAESEAVHRVRRGESLSRIARLYGTTVAAITTANGLSGDLIRVGQLLRVTGN